MSSLETIAKGMFENYSKMRTNKVANWNYLNSERKIVWMKDVLLISDYYANILRNLRPVHSPGVKKFLTSFSLGYDQGIKVERSTLISMIDNFNTSLKNDLEDYLEYSKKEKSE